MADSNITKRALAAALKELINEMPFSKITISDICAKCDMNRKSFYYHFKDKYDLVNWIFDMEFSAIVNRRPHANEWEFFEDVCDYFYENRGFYRRLLKVRGQNSFTEHFREVLEPIVAGRLTEILGEEVNRYQLNFFTDACVCSVERWILDREDVSTKEIIAMMRSCIEKAAVRVVEESKK